MNMSKTMPLPEVIEVSSSYNGTQTAETIDFGNLTESEYRTYICERLYDILEQQSAVSENTAYSKDILEVLTDIRSTLSVNTVSGNILSSNAVSQNSISANITVSTGSIETLLSSVSACNSDIRELQKQQTGLLWVILFALALMTGILLNNVFFKRLRG